MRIHDVARELGVSSEWLRQLERKGEIPRAARDRNDHRRYTPEDLERLRGLLYPPPEGDAK
ncbi:MAG: MerR family transcriptional regulator [Candidatus Methylomirabilis sp.]